MTEQLRFNFDEPKIKTENQELDNLPEEKMVEIVSKATGIPFKYKDDLSGYEYEIKKKVRFNIKYSNFNMKDDHSRFISCDAMLQYGSYYGCGSPIGTVDGAIEFFKEWWEKLGVSEYLKKKGKKK